MIRALFCDFYGTVIHEDDKPVRAITEKIVQSGNAENEKEAGGYWYRQFLSLCAESYGKTFVPSGTWNYNPCRIL